MPAGERGFILACVRCFWYAGRMQGQSVRKRFVESWAGAVSAVLLSVVWVAGMSVADGHASSAVPVLGGLSVVVLLALVGLCLGYRVVRMPWLAWVGLAALSFFVVRALASYSVLDGWKDASLALSAAVFYGAGVYAGQVKGSRWTVVLLVVALAANVGAMALMEPPRASLHWFGRPDVSLCGPNVGNTGLFAYKNFAALFFLMGGSLLFWRAVWQGSAGWKSLLWGGIGAAGMAAAFLCDSRLPYVLLPLLVAAGWVLWLVVRLYHHEGIGVMAALVGIALLTCFLVALYDFFFGYVLMEALLGVDSHLRFEIWAALCQVVPSAPLWGYGAGASQWEILTLFGEWETPNYAHNEFMQLWADYGGIGVGAVLILLVCHVVQGFRAMGAESVDQDRRIKVAMALLLLSGMTLAAITDFVWHQFSLLGMTAFACGILASPFPHDPLFSFHRRCWAPGSRPSARPVRAQGIMGRIGVGALCVLLLGAMGWMACTLFPGWTSQWRYDGMVARHAGEKERHAFLVRAMEDYPDSRIMDHYVMLPFRERIDWAEMEVGLRRALAANPRQLFTVTMLADCLDRQGKYEQAEEIFRRYYPGDGPARNILSSWPAFYAIHLLRWGEHCLGTGETAKGGDLLVYGLEICRRNMMSYPDTSWRSGPRCWTDGGSPAYKRFYQACQADGETFRSLGLRKDDAWRQVSPATGKPALYSRYFEKSPAKPARNGAF